MTKLPEEVEIEELRGPLASCQLQGSAGVCRGLKGPLRQEKGLKAHAETKGQSRVSRHAPAAPSIGWLS